MFSPSKTRDLFAEFYVAGLLADAGWHLYFPKRDHGFDFIAEKTVNGSPIVRPFQVKGKYPEPTKTDKDSYGYSGELTALHKEMVLAIVFFVSKVEKAPRHVAFIPRSQIKNGNKDNWFKSMPCAFKSGDPIPRRDYRKFFDTDGLHLIETSKFSECQVEQPLVTTSQPFLKPIDDRQRLR